MSVKGVFGAIGLWLVFFASLEWFWFFFDLTNGTYVVLYPSFLSVVLLIYITMLIWGGKAYRGREPFLQVFVMSFLFAFAFLVTGWLVGPGSVFTGIVISPP